MVKSLNTRFLNKKKRFNIKFQHKKKQTLSFTQNKKKYKKRPIQYLLACKDSDVAKQKKVKKKDN